MVDLLYYFSNQGDFIKIQKNVWYQIEVKVSRLEFNIFNFVLFQDYTKVIRLVDENC